MKLPMGRAMARLGSLALGCGALALVLGAADAHAGDGAQFSRDCFSTYVNKQVGDTEQWAITWEVFGRASGNVFKLDGSAPSFIECEYVDQNDDAATIIYDCYGASACTGPPCGGSGPQWTLIAENLELPVAFFLPPGADPADPEGSCDLGE